MISFSIFIASITHTTAPASTSWPFSTSTRSTVPWSGDTSVSLAPSCEAAPRERSRRGARRGPRPSSPAAAPAAGGGPITFTAKRRLSTSTV